MVNGRKIPINADGKHPRHPVHHGVVPVTEQPERHQWLLVLRQPLQYQEGDDSRLRHRQSGMLMNEVMVPQLYFCPSTRP